MNAEMISFIGLSAVLTGFNESILSPSLDPVDIKSEYLPFFKEKVAEESGNPDLTHSIFQKFNELKKQGLNNQAIGEAMLAQSNGADFVMACRQLIFMWYSGAWPTVSGTQTFSNLISAKSYTAGLAWQVMQSHPMGDSNYRYGYWASTPADLSNYTGNTGE